MLSAVSPEKMPLALQNIRKILKVRDISILTIVKHINFINFGVMNSMKCEIPICTFQPNGCVLFRDYAIGDLAQVDPLSLSLSVKFFAKIDKTL